MASLWLRRAWLGAAAATAVVLAACGGGTVVSEFKPARVVAFGDAFSDLGQNGYRYTVNNGSTNVWTAQVAQSYGVPLTTAAAGGTSYATGSARVAAKPDAAGNAATPTVTEQIDRLLASGAPQANDLVLLGAGVDDVIAEGFKAIAGTQTAATAETNVRAAGAAYGAQVRRLVAAGAKHVVVTGSYNLGRSPWAGQTGSQALLEKLSLAFNEELLVNIVDLGNTVLYVDAALYLNLVTANPASYSIADVANPLCTSVDPGVGIGTGTGQVSSALCTGGTIRGGVDPAKVLWADRVYLTPIGAQLFGQYAFDRVKQRF
jgi:phospholipase/lecithinase/hemolysin